jgi:hypothetical protein
MLGFGIPLLATWFTYLPFATMLVDKISPYLIWPSTIGTYGLRPLPWLLGNAPTRGQALYLAIIVILNIVFMAVHYESYQPNLWYYGANVEIEAYIVWRTGAYSFALLPLFVLFSARRQHVVVADELVAQDLHRVTSMAGPPLCPACHPALADLRGLLRPGRQVRHQPSRGVVGLGVRWHRCYRGHAAHRSSLG